jgi:hypothetical protein
MNETGGTSGSSTGRKGGNFFDDLAGVAGGAFSALAGVRQEIETMVRSQLDGVVQRLDLVKREELDAAMEVARRAREAADTLEARLVGLEVRLAAQESAAAAARAATAPAPGPANGK